jgi:DNA-binding NtrC family response regulator
MKTLPLLKASKCFEQKLNALSVYIVEDNPSYSFMLTYNLEHEFNFNISNFDSGEECLLNLEIHNHPAIIILDYKLKNMDGISVLQYVKQNFPEIYVIVLTEQKNISIAINIMKRGAFDYLQKSKTSLDELRNSIYKVFVDLNLRDQKRKN